MTADKIKELIGPIHGISLIEDFIIDEAGSLKGRIAVVTDQEHADLEWYVEINPTYPFKTMGMEPIHFQNKNLLDYPHIMQGGNLCMHPAEYDNAESQFVNDLKQFEGMGREILCKGRKGCSLRAFGSESSYDSRAVLYFLFRRDSRGFY